LEIPEIPTRNEMSKGSCSSKETITVLLATQKNKLREKGERE
jgi:hypothetical protein